MAEKESIIFPGTGLNSDDDLRLMKPGDSPVRYDESNPEYGRINVRGSDITDTGDAGTIETIAGTILRTLNLPSGTNVEIGWCKDIEREALILFVYNSNNQHTIRRYYVNTQVDELILQSDVLNFNPDYRIKGADVIDDLLYWNDAYNPPRKINIDRAIRSQEAKVRFTDNSYNGGYVAFLCTTPPSTFNESDEIFIKQDGGALNQYYDDWCKITDITGNTITTNLPWGYNTPLNAGYIYQYDVYTVIEEQTLDRIKYQPATEPEVNVTTCFEIKASAKIRVDSASTAGQGLTITIDEGAILGGSTVDIFTSADLGNTAIDLLGQIFADYINAGATGYSASYDAGTNYLTIYAPAGYGDAGNRLLTNYSGTYPGLNLTNEFYQMDTGRKEYYNEYKNLISSKIFQFRYRYIYDDNEKSIWSSISKLAIPEIAETASGTRLVEQDTQNCIEVKISLGHETVRKIELALREGNIGLWKSIEIIDKKNITLRKLMGTDDSEIWIYPFMNDRALFGLDQKDLSRPFDYVPLISASQEYIQTGNLVDANILEGYDNVEIDVALTENIVTDATFIDDTTIMGKTITSKSTVPKEYYWVLFDISTIVINDEIVCYIEYSGPSVPFKQYISFVYYDEDLSFVNVREKLKDAIRKSMTELSSVYAPLGDGVELGEIFTEQNNDWLISVKNDWEASNPGLNWIDYAPTQLNQYQILIYFRSDLSINNFHNTDITTYKSHIKYNHWKIRKKHEFGLIYHDEAGRHGAVNTNEQSEINIRGFNERVAAITTEFGNADYDKYVRIQWEVNHEAPSWAKKWRWAYAFKEEYYLQIALDMTAVVAPETHKQIEAISGTTRFAIYANKAITSLRLNTLSQVPNYEWTEGDRIRFIAYRDTGEDVFTIIDGIFDYEIKGTDFSSTTVATEPEVYQTEKWGGTHYPIYDESGNRVVYTDNQYLIIDGMIPNYADHDYIQIEIYRSLKETDDINNIYSEIGEVYDVLDMGDGHYYHAGMVNQTSGNSATGTFDGGDSYFKMRYDINKAIQYAVEDRSYSDYIKSEYYNIGRPNVISEDLKQQNFKSTVIYSGRYLDNTNINNLSRVEADNRKLLNEADGPIAKILEVGETLKCFQRERVVSIYIGRVELRSADGSSQLIKDDSLILGNEMVPIVDWGTQYPYSIVKHDRHEYFIDVDSGEAIRDAANGMVPISDYKMRTWFKEKCRAFSRLTDKDIIAGFDDSTNEYIVSFIDNDNGIIETVVFNELTNRWIGFYTFEKSGVFPDMYMVMGNKFFSFIEGELYEHNIGDHGTIYGIGNRESIATIVGGHSAPNMIKNFEAIAIHSNEIWYLPYNDSIIIPSNSQYPRGMYSRIREGHFRSEEGVFYSEFLKNMRTTSDSYLQSDLVDGDHLKGYIIKCELVTVPDGEKRILFSVDIYFTLS